MHAQTGTNDGDDEMSDQTLEALAERLDELEQDYHAERKAMLGRIDDLRDARDDAREERAELAAEVESLREQVQNLDDELQGLIGLADDESSNPAKRCADLRQAMIRRARARDDAYAGKIALYYKEVQDLFADLGHGEVKKPECYKAMKDAAEAEGFELGTKTSKHGNDVEAVRVDLDALPPGVAGSDPTTRETQHSTDERQTSAVEGNSD